MLSRRALLAGISAALLLYAEPFVIPKEVPAFPLWSGGASSGAPALVTSLTLNNTTGSTQSAPWAIFGHIFKQGDIPAGQFPIFKGHGSGTAYKYTYWGKKTWPDGSWLFAGFALNGVDSISNNTTLQVDIYNGGTTPSASGRTNAEISAEGFSQVAIGKANLSGTWTDALATAISDNLEIVEIGNGSAGRLVRILGNYKQSGSAHGQLVDYTYILQRNDGSGNIAGYHYLPRIAQPWYNQDTPTKNERLLSSWTLNWTGGGGGSITPFPYTTPKNFTWSSSNTLTCTHGLPTNTIPVYACQLTTTGTLPAGLSLNTTYYILQRSSTTCSIYTDCNFYGAPTITGAGSGTHTITFYPIVKHFGSLFGAQSNARYQYIQASGSVASDATVQVQHNKAYLRSTGLLPPWNLTFNPSSNDTFTFDLFTIGPLDPYLGNTGERLDIGVTTGFNVIHFMTQAQVDETCARICALSAVHLTPCQKDKTTLGPVNLGDPGVTYTGFPSSVQGNYSYQVGISNGVNLAGAGIPANSDTTGTDQTVSYTGTVFDHMPSLWWYAYVMFGEPQYFDLGVEIANLAVSQARTPNPVLSATTYYGVTTGLPNQTRALAWATREVMGAAGIAPDTSPDGKDIPKYLLDRATGSTSYANAYFNSLNTYIKTAGIFTFIDAANSSWQSDYIAEAMMLGVGFGISGAKTWVQNCRATWYAYRYAADGSMYNANGYYDRYQSDQNSGGAGTALITSDAGWSTVNLNWDAGVGGSLSWSSSTSLFTLVSTPELWTPGNGDKWLWLSDAPNVPGGFSVSTPYYAVQTSGLTFKLSATIGGSPITVTSNGSESNSNFLQTVVATTPSTDVAAGEASDPQSFLAKCRGGTRWMVALGITGLSGALSDLDSRWTASGGTFSSDPKMDRDASF